MVSVSDGRGRPVTDGGLARWLARVAPARARGEVSIALVTDAHIRRLNAQYRRKNVATDVLSFAADSGSDPGSRVPDPGASVPLGDIVIATGVARKQAREAGHSYAAELRVLSLHGLLHLLGYDHDDANDGGRMARVEARLRLKGGLNAGLIQRAATGTSVTPRSRPRKAR
jgi:probable rRNA maturation factor